ncbi:MAG: DUF4105 domain-containing protein [Bacteroidia bacterium]|nr:DUF4105 domain-containing protein [Bacteroidia bacterium]NND24797.1 DUF4105 domain-containing protein [Flavobacteriaceae bacterium]NNL31969.1 DUF4105 domain-containing protein [Flavobacteriaceae bacterium]
MKLKLVLIVFLVFHSTVFSQTRNLSSSAEVTVITVGPGTYLNDAFGHNAIRIKDDSLKLDIAFNYGVYDFQAPNFYSKFAQGKLNYLIGADYFKDFLRQYSSQNRTVREQVLNLNVEEKQRMYDFLVDNYKPENRYYLYDYFYDNCATKIRDVTQEITQKDIQFNNPEGFETKSFRELIHDHVDRNSWGSFGIDLALGSVIDREATAYQHMYLPEYIYRFFDTATYENGESLVTLSRTLYEKKDEEVSTAFIYSPLFVFGLIALMILWVTFSDLKKNKRTIWLDLILFGFTSLIGLFLLALWFGTDHSAAAFNYNLLWAFPLNIIVLFQLFKKSIKGWVIKYLKLLVILIVLLTLHWLIGVQVFAIGLIPLLLALAIRYIYLIRFFRSRTN